MFRWGILPNFIPSLSNLSKEASTLNSIICRMGGEKQECSTLALFYCPFACSVWSCSPLSLKTEELSLTNTMDVSICITLWMIIASSYLSPLLGLYGTAEIRTSSPRLSLQLLLCVLLPQSAGVFQ